MCASVITSGLLWMLALPMFQSDWRFAIGVAQTIGVRQALWVGVLGELLAVIPVYLSPLRKMRELPGELQHAGSKAPAAPNDASVAV
ncbi:hypothetical protein GCM10023194_66650 [Planotetraspora phitsanulokensis]|uniref:Uncharacterized protein n=1 Tax=Planotetraspora phitsanulokensis TaxID=575192 RepID=A0A8J3U700_9ACTN|nr:hypothetical protein [Planotetraspora phitsanulokensis]GII39773.1 hypothetical protein Pph01_47760 [Planotetraspora phitsanulokensis]